MTDIDFNSLHVKCDGKIVALGREKDELLATLNNVRATCARVSAEKERILNVIRQQFIDNEVDAFDGNVEELVKLGMKPLSRDITVCAQFNGHVEFTFEGVDYQTSKEDFERQVREELSGDSCPDWDRTANQISHLTDGGAAVTERFVDWGRITTEEIT